MKSEVDSLSGRFVDRLKLLVFFHLGADANCAIRSTSDGLEASIEHSRIDPFDLKVRFEELENIVNSPGRIERLFLELLVKNRRG